MTTVIRVRYGMRGLDEPDLLIIPVVVESGKEGYLRVREYKDGRYELRGKFTSSQPTFNCSDAQRETLDIESERKLMELIEETECKIRE